MTSVSSPPPTDPGTRLARGTRLGSPAVVVSPAVGDAATRAARHPSSAGEFQLGASADAVVELSDLPLRRNQSDSSESKIGSRWSGAPATAGGIVTWLPSEPLAPLPPTEVPFGPPALAAPSAGSGPVPAFPPSPPNAGIRAVPKSESPESLPPNAESPVPAGPPARCGPLPPGCRVGSEPGVPVVPAGSPAAPEPPLPEPVPLSGPPENLGTRAAAAAAAAAVPNPPVSPVPPGPANPGPAGGPNGSP